MLDSDIMISKYIILPTIAWSSSKQDRFREPFAMFVGWTPCNDIVRRSLTLRLRKDTIVIKYLIIKHSGSYLIQKERMLYSVYKFSSLLNLPKISSN